MNEKEPNGGADSRNTGEFERIRSESFKEKHDLSYEDAKFFATWSSHEIQAFWKKAIDDFDSLLTDGVTNYERK